MAEQEACADLVDKASQEQIGTTFEGESQLLPLLQGLLEAPDNEQTADSGTESGEDQRNGLIAEVQNALDKLSANLRDDATDITPERRTSLLQLVTKLQAGLAGSVPLPERRASVQGRFRRRQRPNRHTVGVSSEELADARRLIEEISSHELTPQPSRTKVSLLQKQNSEGSVVPKATSSIKPMLAQKSLVKNATPKPFSSSNSTVSGNSSSVQTPTESLDFLFNEEGTEKKPDSTRRSISLDEQNIRRSSSGDVSIKSVQQAVQQAAARKSTENLLESEETDEDSTMKAHAMEIEEKIEPEEQPCNELSQPDIVMQTNPIYQNFTNEDKMNRFNTKKLKMKRANTIDIPKPLNFYEDDADSDCSLPEEDYQQRRRSHYLALRGPIRIGNPNIKNTMPVFEPKTDSDKKFLAFINKHNENNTVKHDVTKNSIWSKSENNRGSIWNNKFGNIKTAFEKASSGPMPSQNSARQFWKTADDAVSSGPKYDGPKISKQSARNLRQMFEDKQKQTQRVPWSPTQNDKNIVTGSLKVKAFEPSNDKTYKFVPQPLPVNKFSHAPQSAFKPIPKKVLPTLEISKTPVKSDNQGKDSDSPLYLYSPKLSPKLSNEPSLKPWATNQGESRVLSLAASKFENFFTPEPVPVKPRRLSKDKITPFQQPIPEKLSAPYLVKSVEQKTNNVKQLSGQYDNTAGKNNDAYATYSTVKYVSPHSERTPARNDHYNQKSQSNIQNQYHHQYQPNQPLQQENHHNQYPRVPQHRQEHLLKNRDQSTFAYQQHLRQEESPQYKAHNQNYPATSHQYYPQHHNQNQAQLSQTQHSTYPQKQFVSSNYGPQNPVSLCYSYSDEEENERAANIRRNQQIEPKSPDYKNIHLQQSKPAAAHQYNDHQQNEQQYTSTYQYQPQIKTPPSPAQTSNQRLPQEKQEVQSKPHQPPKVESQLSIEGVKEYNAVTSRVMTGPVSQQATTVRQKSPMNRNEHDMAAALNLRNALQKVSPRPDTSPQKIVNTNNTNSAINRDIKKTVIPDSKPKENPVVTSPIYNRSEESSPIGAIYNNVSYRNVERTQPFVNTNISKVKEDPPKIMSPPHYNYKSKEQQPRISPNSFSYKPREDVQRIVSPHTFSYKSRETASTNSSNYRGERPNVPIESLEINDKGESVVSLKFQIPVINVPEPESPRPTQAKIANKQDSWNQICLQKTMHKPSPRGSPNARMVAKSKSSHTLVVPKQFEAGMSKDEMANKRKTMEAFFISGNKSPQSLSRTSSNDNLTNKHESKNVKRTINRLKTSEKISTYHQSGLSRSRTLPDIVCPNMLDESNVDQAFDELFKSST